MVHEPSNQHEFNLLVKGAKKPLDKEGDEYKELIKGYEDQLNAFMSTDGMYIYHIGIIDYLQEFIWNKQIENKIKTYTSDGKYISAVHPDWYCQRFFEFMQKEVIINQDH